MKIDTQLKVNQNLKCVFSNRLEILADLLAGNLFARQTAVFERRYVVVPNETIGEFLVFHLASTLQIAAGFSLLSLDQAIAQLLQSCDLFQRVPSFLELSLMIEEKLHLGLRTCSSLFTQVDEYLFSQDPESEQSQKKLIALSQQLAQLFIRYGTYAKAFLPQWLMQKGWQQWLWLQIFSEKSPFISLMAALHGRYVQEAQVHLFGFSYLPPCYLPFFSESCAVLYQFSPCSHYWQDFCSDRQRLSLMRHLDAKGAKREIKEQMDHYLQESHPLLANWGRLGREFLQQLDAYDLDTQEHYVPDANTLLGRIKNSLLHLEVMESVDSDDSIQVHSATSKLREVEVLCELIHTLLVRHATDALPLQPRDILILAADITEYAPYIHAVFSNTQIAYRIDGLEEGSRSDFAQAFFYFFSLSEQEFSLDAVFKLFLMPAFRKRCGLSVDEIDEVYQWLKYAQVRSGQKSWQEAIDRLLWGLAMQIDEQGIKSHPLYPLSCIGQTQIEIFDKFLVCFLSVKEALDQLQAKGKMSLSEWMQWLFDLSCKLFDCDLENDPLLTALQALSIKHLQSKHWTFLSVQRILRALYEKRTASIEAQHLQSLHFCSLQSGSVRPSRLIYVLGLDEGKFPRYEPKLTLCALTSGPNPPYIPTQADKDRYLFLELLCHARDYYILSYERIHAEDNKPQGPSYLIEELLHYAKGVIKVLDSERMIPNPENVLELGEKTSLSSSCVRSPFFLPLSPSTADPQIFTVSTLRKLARHPIRFFFNEALGIYIKQEESLEDAAFCLSSLQAALLKSASLKSEFEQLVERSHKQGLLPEGIFKDAAIYSLREEVEELHASLLPFSLAANMLFSITFSPHCQTPLCDQRGNWILPALTLFVEDKQIIVTGTLDNLSPKGYLVHAKQDLETLIAIWPLFLLYAQVRKAIGEPPATLLFSKSASQLHLPDEQLARYLEEYMAYALRAKRSVSPLMPKWASCLLSKKVEVFEKCLYSALQKDLSFYSDPYLQWIKQAGISLDARQLHREWASYLQDSFAPLLKILSGDS